MKLVEEDGEHHGGGRQRLGDVGEEAARHQNTSGGLDHGLAYRQAFVAELIGAQGRRMDIGGYYHPDEAKVAAVMRPSATLNAVIDAL